MMVIYWTVVGDILVPEREWKRALIQHFTSRFHQLFSHFLFHVFAQFNIWPSLSSLRIFMLVGNHLIHERGIRAMW
jgi:hypothetical protein